LAANDVRFKLDRIHQSELVERQGALGPMCFGPRIMGEPVPYSFQLARVILKVDVGDQRSLCVVNDQPVGNPKRKV
jgi:hypothetical protein